MNVESKKDKGLYRVYQWCKKNNTSEFHNEVVKQLSKECGFGNPFDATKLDSTDKLPKFMIDGNLCILHLGGGYHRFIKGINTLYHQFEPIQNKVEWHYRPSLLNEYNDSESNILSVANNQRILHNFLFNLDSEFSNLDIIARPKTYFPHRTKTTLNYFFGDIPITSTNQQIEIDLTIEYNGVISVFEAKNGEPKDFNIYQLYHPFLYYYKAFPSNKIYCCYLVRMGKAIKLYLYTFIKPLQIASIKFIKNAEYILIHS